MISPDLIINLYEKLSADGIAPERLKEVVLDHADCVLITSGLSERNQRERMQRFYAEIDAIEAANKAIALGGRRNVHPVQTDVRGGSCICAETNSAKGGIDAKAD